MIRGAWTHKAVSGLIGLLVSVTTVNAQSLEEYPAQPIRLVVPYAPGGSSDGTARALADKASQILGQPIIIVNKAGAGGTIGTAFVASSDPDGYTLGLVAPGQLSITPHLQKVSYDPIDGLTPIAQYAAFSLALVVREDSPYKTLKDYISAARSAPGEIDYGTTGIGSIGQLMMEQLAGYENMKLTSVPYTGGAPALTALLGGHIKSYAAAEYYSHVEAGQIRVLAFLGESKPQEMSEVPTLGDLGYPFKYGVYFGIVGPKGLPPSIVKKLENAFIEAAQDPKFISTMESFKLQVKTRGSEEFRSLIKMGYDENKAIISKLGLGDK